MNPSGGVMKICLAILNSILGQRQDMFGLGWPEILLILGVVIIIFGPKRIPELGGALGKTLRGFREELNTKDVEGTEITDANIADKDDSPSQWGSQSDSSRRS